MFVQLAAAGAGRPISDTIPDTVDRINFDYAYKAAAIVHKNFYVVAVPVDGSQTNNLLLVYDLVNGEWHTVL